MPLSTIYGKIYNGDIKSGCRKTEMGQTVIKLGDHADLILDEPSAVSSTERALILTEIVTQEFSATGIRNPSVHTGSLPVQIGSTIYRIYYQLKVNRIMNALTAYSEAIRHIENNSHLYDRRLARKAIEVLRECYLSELE
jgi:hypothetical protein